MATQNEGTKKPRKGLMERLKEGIVIGDGGSVIALEKRGYLKAGPWTPEAVIEHPEAVEQLQREFLRAGSDVIQACTFYSSDDKLKLGDDSVTKKKITCKDIIENGCRIARKVADSGDALVAGTINKNPAYHPEKKGKAYVQSEVRKQAELYKKCGIDIIICEFFLSIEEMEWTIEECLKVGLPVVATMTMGEMGDYDDVSPGDCGVRMVKAGAHVVGLNCHYDPNTIIRTLKMMKVGLKNAGLDPYLITQPCGFFTTGAGRGGYADVPEFPFAMEPRTITRIDAQKYAREAYELGVRYIGGCCGFESHHIRGIAEELSPERGFLPKGSDKHEPWGGALKMSMTRKTREKASREYWENMVPSSGREEPPTYPLKKE